MSDTDSFIDEVSEEVRRDKLFGYIRKYGWIAITSVLLLGYVFTYYEGLARIRVSTAAALLGDVAEVLHFPAVRQAVVVAVTNDRPVTGHVRDGGLDQVNRVTGVVDTQAAVFLNEAVVVGRLQLGPGIGRRGVDCRRIQGNCEFNFR